MKKGRSLKQSLGLLCGLIAAACAVLYSITLVYVLETAENKLMASVMDDMLQTVVTADILQGKPPRLDQVTRLYIEGEAYFKVTKDTKPFIVKTDYLQTKVLGTEFNVKSYTAEDSHVTLISGKVQVRSHENARFVDLEPGKDAILLSNGQFEVKEVNSEAYTYWKDGYFYFDELTLADIMKSIGRWYNVNVIFRNKEAMAYRIHFMSNRQGGIEETIRLMNRLKKVTLTLCENTVYVD